MILLVDLDGTLLSNRMESFQPHYFKALGAHLAEVVPADSMLPALFAGTRKMLENNDPRVTLEATFDRHFYPALGLEKAGINPRIMQFYEHDFPALGKYSRQIPEAIDFISSRLSAGDRIVVATNPLFPRVATLARLAWAGLPVAAIDFDLITTYEIMHFSKPHPEYFAEILAYLGYPDEPVIMIGNDLMDDIQPAVSLAIPGYWLTAFEPIQGESAAYRPAGNYYDLTKYIENGFKSIDLYATRSVPVLMTFLKATLATLHSYQLLSERRPGELTGKLRQLISERFLHEQELLDKSPIHDKLTLNIDPPDGDHNSDLAGFSNFRLAWLKEISGPAVKAITPSGSELCSLLQVSIVNDRKTLMECTKWQKYLPEITNHTDRKPC